MPPTRNIAAPAPAVCLPVRPGQLCALLWWIAAVVSLITRLKTGRRRCQRRLPPICRAGWLGVTFARRCAPGTNGLPNPPILLNLRPVYPLCPCGRGRKWMGKPGIGVCGGRLCGGLNRSCGGAPPKPYWRMVPMIPNDREIEPHPQGDYRPPITTFLIRTWGPPTLTGRGDCPALPQPPLR